MQVVYSAAARRDLRSILVYTTQTFGPKRARRYLLQIQDGCEAVATGRKPTRVLALDGVSYRFHASGSHFVFHRRAGDTLFVIRVLHRRMQIEDHL